MTEKDQQRREQRVDAEVTRVPDYMIATKALTRPFSAAALFANAHPRVVLLILLALAVDVVGLAVLGAG